MLIISATWGSKSWDEKVAIMINNHGWIKSERCVYM